MKSAKDKIRPSELPKLRLSLSGVIAGGSAQALARVAGITTSLVTAPLLARHLGAEGFGQFSLVLTLLFFLAMLGDFGFPILASRDWPALPKVRRPEWLRRFWGARYVLALLIPLAGLGLTPLLPFGSAVRVGYLIGLLALPAAMIAAAAAGLFNAELRLGEPAIAEVVQRGAWLTGVAMVLTLGLGVLWVVGAHLVAQVVAAAVIVILAHRRRLFSGPSRLSISAIAVMARRAAPLAILPVLGLIYARSDTLILAIRATEAEVGIYAAMWKVLEILMSFWAIPVSLLLPILAGTSDPAVQRRTYIRMQRLVAILIYPASVTLAISGDRVLRLLVGNSFMASVPSNGLVRPEVAFVILMATVPLMVVNSINGAAMLALRLDRVHVRHFLYFVPLNALLTAWWTGPFSYAGAAGATLASALAAVIYSSMAVRRRLGPLKVTVNLAWPISMSILLGLVLTVVDNLWAQILSGGLVVLGVMVLSPLRDDWLWILERLHPSGYSLPVRLFRRTRVILLRGFGMPITPPDEVPSLLSPIETRMRDRAFGYGESERVVEIPWCLSRYRGERRVLEVGYAYAEDRYLAALRRLAIPELHGFDQASTHRPWLRRQRGDIRSTGYPDDYFDLVLCISTIEHIGMDTTEYGGAKEHDDNADFKTIRELQRIIRPGGRLLLTVPFGRGGDGGWYRHYDSERWGTLLGSSGMTVTAQSFFRYEANRGWRTALPEELADVDYQDEGAPNAAGLACVELTKSEDRGIRKVPEKGTL